MELNSTSMSTLSTQIIINIIIDFITMAILYVYK